MTREGSKRRKMNAVVSAASLTSIDPFAPTIDQHDADLAVLVDQVMLRVPMLNPNITSPPVELPSESIATASVDDTLSTAAGTVVMGRRKRQRGKNVRQPNVEENPLPLISVTTAERIEEQSGTPNGIIPIPGTILTLIPRNIPDAEPVLLETPPQGVPSEQTLDATQSITPPQGAPQESTPPQGVPTNNKISDDHYKWFTSVHNC